MFGSVPHQETLPLSHLTAPRGLIRCSLTFPSRSLAVTGWMVFDFLCFKIWSYQPNRGTKEAKSLEGECQ